MTSTPSSKPCTEIGPLRTLLATAVDHAGLFPPAGLNMSAAVADFHARRHGEVRWMLGSFVVPASRVGELAASVREYVGPAEATADVSYAARAEPWPLSVIVESAVEGAGVIEDVRRRHGDDLRVVALEVRPLEAEKIQGGQREPSAKALDEVATFYEVPLDERMEARLDAVASVGAHAKVRTGGVTAEAFPTTAALVGFLVACAERAVSFKATAGLHHPFRGRYPLTYEPGSARATMHGFLGLALVSALIHQRAVDEREASGLLAGGPEDLELAADALVWHGHRLTTEEIERARGFFRSFGSCSFDEPVAELQQAGLL
jgi:hypothetical protein